MIDDVTFANCSITNPFELIKMFVFICTSYVTRNETKIRCNDILND